MVATVLGGCFAAGGANAINMYIDRDIDQLMERTKKRPLVTGAISPRNALVFALSLEVIALLTKRFGLHVLSRALLVKYLGFLY